MPKQSERVLLSLGSNVGNREDYLRSAEELIASHPDIQVLRKSTVLENKALLFEDQPDFLNRLIEIETNLIAEKLLDVLQDIEQRTGRIKRFKNGPREIDLDIVFFGDQTIRTERLTVPHPGVKDRQYLHILLAELGWPGFSQEE